MFEYILLAASDPKKTGKKKGRFSGIYDKGKLFNISTLWDTIKIILEVIKVYKVSLPIRALAIRLTRDEKTLEGKLKSVYDFASNRVKYLSDVLNVETIHSPIQTIRTRAGDCDDFAVLIASLLASVGIPSFLVVASNRKDKIPNHIYNMVSINEKIFWLDGTKKKFNIERPDITFKKLVGVK